jgi:hypothetical protein
MGTPSARINVEPPPRVAPSTAVAASTLDESRHGRYIDARSMSCREAEEIGDGGPYFGGDGETQ